MYLNEKAWEIQQDDPYIVKEALENFLKIYSALAKDFRMSEIYVPADTELYLQSTVYPIGKWLSEADREYKRLFLSLWQKRICYNPEEDYEVTLGGVQLKGGTEAFLNNSFLLSLCLDDSWKKAQIEAEFFSLTDNYTEMIRIDNVYIKEQLYTNSMSERLNKFREYQVFSYEELWKQRSTLFQYLKFCPSVEDDLKILEKSYLKQVIKKLTELDNYCFKYGDGGFNPEFLTKTTPESDVTLEKYKKQHTFVDDEKETHIAKWHMRFTGIPGRIFFIPQYKGKNILICYIGKKLQNVTYPT